MTQTDVQDVLDVRGLETVYFQGHDAVPAVRGIDLSIGAGQATALVGESGSGKSTAALSVMRLINPPIGTVAAGSARLGGRDLFQLDAKAMRNVLLHDIGYIPQDPTTALDPLFTVRTQIGEAATGTANRREQDAAIVALLDRLGVKDAAARLKAYPHEFSGGMRQRVAIAIALAKDPQLLIADEPTTALDVTTQLGILRLLDELRRERDLAVLFVTHDLAVARLVCQHVAVMYAGLIVESGPIGTVLSTPRHPYTRALLDADPGLAEAPRTTLRAIPGQPPALTDLPPGCPFAPRCPLAEEACTRAIPEATVYGGVSVRCIKADHAMTTRTRVGA
jgi:oligopeptide/dipeptide ABC transporter ATP-binding protein